MIGASGVGKTAFFLYPNLEFSCASGMSFLALDTKGDLARNYGTIATERYGYQVAVIDLRNPTRSDGNNFLALVNQYMDISVKESENVAAKAKAEKYAKILAKTIISPDGDSSNRGQNAFFYDAAEGLLTSVILLLAEFLPPKEIDGQMQERRHIVSVFKLVQDLLEPASGANKGKSQFQVLMSKLPSEHKARWFAGAALNTSEQAMASVLSTVLSRLNAFLDSELEQILCFEPSINAESFARKKSAIFLILPEEDPSKNFMAGLMIQQLSRELFAVADENGGKLQNRRWCRSSSLWRNWRKTMEKKALRSLRTIARTRFLAASPPTARLRRCCPKHWEIRRCRAVMSARRRMGSTSPSRW